MFVVVGARLGVALRLIDLLIKSIVLT